MQYLSVIGLVLDMVGVVILSADLIRLQRRLRRDASERLASLHEIADDNEGADEWVRALALNADWREHDWNEGRAVPFGSTFDPHAAQASFTDAMTYVGGVSSDMHKVAKLLLTTAETDENTASLSLRVSYLGLILITVGFALQAAGQLITM